MKKRLLQTAGCLLGLAISAWGQQGADVALQFGTLSAPSTISTTTNFQQSLRGGTYFGFNGDVLIKRNFGIQGEVAWRTSQGLYGGQIPFRPIFFDVNGIYSRRLNHWAGVEGLAGIGALSSRFYGSAFESCDVYGFCTNYQSSNHFMADFGGGIRLYPYHNVFVRPEARLYLIHNNVEFSSGHAVRFGLSIGYTFGGSR
jgi:hypothetical protein